MAPESSITHKHLNIVVTYLPRRTATTKLPPSLTTSLKPKSLPKNVVLWPSLVGSLFIIQTTTPQLITEEWDGEKMRKKMDSLATSKSVATT